MFKNRKKTKFSQLTSYLINQLTNFLQNKPNFQNAKINVSSFNKKDYEKKTLGECGKNKPNSNPNKPNFSTKQSQSNPKQTQCLYCFL